MAVGSVYAVTFAGEELDVVDMTARVGGGSVLPRVRRHNDRHLRSLFLGGPPITFLRDFPRKTARSTMILPTAIQVLKRWPYRCWVKYAARWRSGSSRVSGDRRERRVACVFENRHLNLEVIEELNERYAHTCLTTSTHMFLLLVGHALAGEDVPWTSRTVSST